MSVSSEVDGAGKCLAGSCRHSSGGDRGSAAVRSEKRAAHAVDSSIQPKRCSARDHSHASSCQTAIWQLSPVGLRGWGVRSCTDVSGLMLELLLSRCIRVLTLREEETFRFETMPFEA
jgi:hypothetical protein